MQRTWRLLQAEHKEAPPVTEQLGILGSVWPCEFFKKDHLELVNLSGHEDRGL